MVDHGWDRPTANLTAARATTINAGAIVNDGRPYRWGGYEVLRGNRSVYGWRGYYSVSTDSPYYRIYYPNYSYYPYDDSSGSSGSQTDPGASGAPSRPASSSPAPGDKSAASADNGAAAAERQMDLARQAFQKGDYAQAQKECEGAIQQLPADANLREFRALCQFARGKYKDAADALYPALAARPGWDWKTVSSFYTGADAYTTQLRALERYVTDNPKDAAGRFVLAYHYLVLDERDAAAGQLREVVKLQPKDLTSPAILEALEKAKDGKDRAPVDKPAPGR